LLNSDGAGRPHPAGRVCMLYGVADSSYDTPRVLRKLAYYIKRPSVGWQYCTPRSNCRVSPSVFEYTTYPFSINTVTHPSTERLPSPSSLLLPPSPPPSSGKKKYQNKTTEKPNDRAEPFRRGHRLRKIRKHGFLPTWQSLAQY